MIDDRVAGDAEQPRLERPGRVDPLPGAPDLEEDHLQQVVGLLLADEAAQVAAHHGAVEAVALLEGLLFAVDHPFGEGQVDQPAHRSRSRGELRAGRRFPLVGYLAVGTVHRRDLRPKDPIGCHEF